MRELSSLIGLQVISTSEGKKLGSIAEAYVDLAAGELVCVTLAKTPELRVILARDIDVIGSDAVMVADHTKLRSREETEEELQRGKRVLSSPPLVITSQGRTLGDLGPVQIDEVTKRVLRFEVTGGALRDFTDGVLALPVLDGIVHGDDTVIVPHEVVARRLVQAGGLRGALRNLGERLKVGAEDLGEISRDQSVKIKERAEVLAKKAAEATEKAKERIGEVAEDAREKAAEATEKAKERIGEVAEDAREKAAEATDKAKERIGEVAEDAREAIKREDSADVTAAPDIEPDAPRIEDAPVEVAPAEDVAAAEEESVAEVSGEVEMHLVPEVATPLPAGEEIEERAPSHAVSDDSSDEEPG